MAKHPVKNEEPLDLDLSGEDEAEAPVLYRICRELIAEHGLVKEAAAALVEMAEADDALYAVLMHDALLHRAELAIRQVMGQQRRNTWRTTARAGAHSRAMASISPSVLTHWAEEVRVGLLDKFTLPDGTPLRQATREQVVMAAERYRTQAATLAGYSVFLDLIGQSLQPGEVVGDRISDARAVELQHAALTEYTAPDVEPHPA